MNLFLTGALFVIIWLAISGSYTLPNLLLGAVIAALSLGLVRHQLVRSDSRRVHLIPLLGLIVLFIKELALSAWTVAKLVVQPRMELKPGIFAYPLEFHTPKLPGLGDVNWGEFFSVLSDSGYDGPVCVEVEDRAYEGSIERRKASLIQSQRYLSQFVE